MPLRKLLRTCKAMRIKGHVILDELGGWPVEEFRSMTSCVRMCAHIWHMLRVLLWSLQMSCKAIMDVLEHLALQRLRDVTRCQHPHSGSFSGDIG